MKKIFLLFVISHITIATFSQIIDSTQIRTQVSGSIAVTNNGISLAPTFTLEKPAAILILLSEKID